MSKKKIVLADNSYTIRRIVELSFSEEENIQLISFENGLNLKEKLMELTPEIVLVDIKLPEINGYEICKFINQTNAFKKTKVFLMKGGFEPVNEELLKGLNYVDIITKPFDSNALVSSIKKVLAEMPAAAPASVPEDLSSQFPDALPEIDSFEPQEEDISFSDIKEEMHADDIIGASQDPGTERYLRDEVLPSEEITVGAQPDREDNLRADFGSDDLFNPFQEDGSANQSPHSGLDQEEIDIKQHIKEQEKELQIASLTQEEINIKKYIEEQKLEAQRESSGIPETPGFINDETAERPLVEDQLTQEESAQEEMLPDFDIMPPSPGQSSSLDQFPEEFQSDSFSEDDTFPQPDMPSSPEEELGLSSPPPIPETPPMPQTFKQAAIIPPPQPPKPTLPQEPVMPPTSLLEQEPPEPSGTFFDDDFPTDLDSEIGLEDEAAPGFTPPTLHEQKSGLNQFSKPSVSDDFHPGFQDPFEQPKFKQEPPQKPAPPAPPKPEPQRIVEEPVTTFNKDELTKKIEDKLTLAIKEILWEIAPPLAEKLIKEEIGRIKSELDITTE